MDILLGDFLIHKFKISNWEETKIKLMNIYDKSNKDICGNVITNWNQSERTREFLKEAVAILKDDIESFKEKYRINHNVIDIWFQEYHSGMDHRIHDHGLYGYSSVVYIEYDPKEHEPTTFVNAKTKEIFQPEVEEGDIIFFKSKYKHCSPPNKSEKRRIVCSFNIKPDRFDNFSY